MCYVKCLRLTKINILFLYQRPRVCTLGRFNDIALKEGEGSAVI